MVCPRTSGLAEPNFVVELDRRPFNAAPDIRDRSIPMLQDMTPAERDVAIVLASGLSNQEIADQLGKSIHAVTFLLHGIYKKSGFGSRAALIAALLSWS